jgi:hypothetical protein
MKTLAFLLILSAAPLFAQADIPDNYKDLKFGSDTAKLRKQYPSSEMQLFSLERRNDTAVAGLQTYSLINKKSPVDSVRFYYLDNKLAMAVEYYYPGRDFLEQAIKTVASKYGQFVGQGTTYWRKRDPYMVRIGLLPKVEIATVSYMDTRKTAKMEERLNSQASEEVKALDRELKNLGEELKKLDKPDSKK